MKRPSGSGRTWKAAGFPGPSGLSGRTTGAGESALVPSWDGAAEPGLAPGGWSDAPALAGPLGPGCPSAPSLPRIGSGTESDGTGDPAGGTATTVPCSVAADFDGPLTDCRGERRPENAHADKRRHNSDDQVIAHLSAPRCSDNGHRRQIRSMSSSREKSPSRSPISASQWSCLKFHWGKKRNALRLYGSPDRGSNWQGPRRSAQHPSPPIAACLSLNKAIVLPRINRTHDGVIILHRIRNIGQRAIRHTIRNTSFFLFLFLLLCGPLRLRVLCVLSFRFQILNAEGAEAQRAAEEEEEETDDGAETAELNLCRPMPWRSWSTRAIRAVWIESTDLDPCYGTRTAIERSAHCADHPAFHTHRSSCPNRN